MEPLANHASTYLLAPIPITHCKWVDQLSVESFLTLTDWSIYKPHLRIDCSNL